MKELKITPIKDGTVIDHITAGSALKVLRILGITGEEGYTVSVAMNVTSKKESLKDVVKIEGRELKPEEINKISLIAPRATINIIRDYNVVKKYRVQIPDVLEGIAKCENPNCISNQREPIQPVLKVISRNPLRIKCVYCGRVQSQVEKNLI
ncbi:MAG: aspartate carbamoyltransferase regulatory subunit [Thermoplasmata archaeon]|nr:aspartate carbamoyltransferase regulatory subunit [Thermoplasmata archaeon]